MARNKTTQDFIPLKEIRQEVAILKDGSLRMILMVSSLNFSLKSENEKTAILMQYQSFLNSLDFDLQIFVQSRRLDIKPYLQTLQERLKEQGSELLKIQTGEYIDFIKNFVDNTNIMSKNFFVVVPYYPPIIQLRKTQGVWEKIFKRQKKSVEDNNDFLENRQQLTQRALVIEEGLGRIGLRSTPLDTEGLIELFYKIFNPGELNAPGLANQAINAN